MEHHLSTITAFALAPFSFCSVVQVSFRSVASSSTRRETLGKGWVIEMLMLMELTPNDLSSGSLGLGGASDALPFYCVDRPLASRLGRGDNIGPL